jgi:hypothetical protein
MRSLRLHPGALAVMAALAACEMAPDEQPSDHEQTDQPVASGRPCAGPTGATCGVGEYCQGPINRCPGPLEPGLCVKAPQFCALIHAPVCGCDGKTYDSSCDAARASVSVARFGACDPSPGCRSNADCAGPRTYCQSAAGSCGGGTCQPRPQLCALISAPVGGCDGRTYDNECRAGVAGVSVAKAGRCGPELF